MIFPQDPDIVIEKDVHGVIRELRHLQAPAKGEPGEPAKQAALDYLTWASQRERPLLPLSREDLAYLSHTIGADETSRSSESRFAWAEPRELRRNDHLETTIVWVRQTTPVKNSDLVVDIQGSSIRLVVNDGPDDQPQITSARLTTLGNAELSIDVESVEKLIGKLKPTWADALDPDVALKLFGSALGLDGSAGAVIDARLVAYERHGRKTAGGDVSLGLAASATVFLPVGSGDSIAHRVLVDVVSGQAVRKAPIASACLGSVFSIDPDSKEGNFKARHDSGDNLLDPERDSVTLLDLNYASGGRRALTGPRVSVLDPSALGKYYDPPTQRPPFEFSARTNNFAAVSAYYHCDSMMRLVEGFGFSLQDHFGKVALPLTVEHRAKMLSGPGARDGRGINAYVTPFRADALLPQLDVRMLFGLADFADTWKNPLGLAADARFVWHEFCHVLILAATDSTEFDFAHSAGDALGAIMSDPASKLGAPWRGVTFPFVQLPLRRHDRKVTDGWGWSGTLYEKPDPTYPPRDPAGYNSEQILSSTLFGLYLAVGGDAVRPNAADELEPDVGARKAAANYIAYLIIRAIASLAPVSTQPTREASQFATALMDADVGTSYIDYNGSRRLGGMLHKVVRWAFEQQGLYQASLTGRHDGPGSAPSIDIYIDSPRGGGYEYHYEWQAAKDAVWIRYAADDGTDDQDPPRAGQTNYVYVKLHNRGDQPAAGTSVVVFTALDDDVATWETAGQWQQLGNEITGSVPAGGEATFGPFPWTPQSGSRNGLLVRSTAAGDRSNIDPGSNLACAAGPVNLADLVRADNNLGYREWIIQ
ncbi:hypothetical protein [Bradyrhizobium sp. UFLA05-112]